MMKPFHSRFGRVVLSVIVLSCVLVSVARASAERRVALVIGNAAYTHTGRLQNALNDANAMRDLFTKAGFETVEAKNDMGVTAFRRALADFQFQAQDADVAVVYYSGHGLELDSQNYLVPVDAEIKRSVDVQDEAISLKRVIDAIAGARRLKIVILDACRNDPFKVSSTTRSLTRGLARIEPAETNELIAYSAKAGTVAADGDAAGTHSPYTSALLKHIATPGLDIELALRRVRDDVIKSTRGAQEPFYYGSVGGDEIPLLAKSGASTALGDNPRTAGAAQSTSPFPVAPASPPASTDAKVARLEPDADAVKLCDTLAASRFDASRPDDVEGVAPDKISIGRAIVACQTAHALKPTDPRITFELARTMGQAGDFEQALRFYRISAEAGYAASMANLGVLYEKGRGVRPDLDEAIRWYRKGAAAGNIVAQHNLAKQYIDGHGVAKNDVEAIRLLQRAADAGFAASMAKLGYMYETGQGTREDLVEAVRWYRKAAEAGNIHAMTQLGYMLATGRGVANNDIEAVRWYRLAAEGGHGLAMNNLGYMYEKGRGGLARDRAEAIRWYNRALGTGEPRANVNLDRLARR